MKHGVYRVSPGYPKGEQIDALHAEGVTDKYIFDFATWAADITTIRRKEILCVKGLDRLGEDWDEMIAALEDCEKRGIRVFNTESRRFADPGPAADLIVASRRLVGERRRLSDAQYKKISKKLTGRRKKWAIPFDVAAKHWFDLAIATNEEAAEKITKLNKAAGGKAITVAMLQKKFPGGSKRPSGWRRGQKRNE